MSTDLAFLGGVAPDVVIRDNQVHVVFGPSPWTWLVFDLDGRLVDRRTQPTGYFPKTDGKVSLAHDGERFVWWGADGTLEQPPGQPIGNNPTGISRGGLVFYQRAATDGYEGGIYCGEKRIRDFCPTGIWACHDDETCATWDDSFYGLRPPGGAGLTHHSADGRIVVCEAGEGGVVGTADGAPFLLWPSLVTMWPRCASNGTFAVVVSWDGAGPTTRIWVGTLAELAAMAAPVTVLSAPPHLKGCGYFFRDTQQYRDNPSAPCTHSVIVDEPRALPAEPQSDGTPTRMILGLTCLLHEQIAEWWNRVDAVYIAAEGSRNNLETLAGLARYIMAWRNLAPKPILFYTGNTLYPDALAATDIIGVPLYLGQGEGPADLLALAESTYPVVKSRRVAIIAMAFDRLGWFTGDELAALQPDYYEIARSWPNCEYLLWFSDGRPGGTRDHEEMRAWHAAINTAIREAHP